ncbi:MAG: ABC transporter ATP-binding protein [Patescibacteria group bacterium]
MTIKPNAELTYSLDKDTVKHPGGFWKSTKQFFGYIKGDGGKLLVGFAMVLIDAAAAMLTPFMIARAIDQYISIGDLQGLIVICFQLIAIYFVTMVSGYIQGIFVGSVSQRTLFRLRESIFSKLQSLPIAFFNQNKAGDLMSRINNDTEKLNQFLSDSVVRFLGSFFTIFGVAIFVFFINVKLSLVMLITAVGLAILTRLVSPLVGRLNKKTARNVGDMSAALQENLTNFRVVVAFGKRQYFRDFLDKVNRKNYEATIYSDSANKLFEPIYDFAGGVALVAVLWYGLFLLSTGEITIGILIAFASYTQRFYSPLQYLATIVGEVQVSLAAWARVLAVFSMRSDLPVFENVQTEKTKNIRLELKNVSFGYEGGGLVVEDVNLSFEEGKTYALVGPTGGGKSTLVSLMSRLYDPLSGIITIDGKDIRSYESVERSQLISVILQDPILFSGTVGDNIRYGNVALLEVDDIDLDKLLRTRGFAEVLSRFDQGLATPVSQTGGASLSLGQKQLISFMRAILRQPKLLILDEATANIDTVTEAMLNQALEALPKDTTKVIIAHRLNTIKEADEIMFVNGHHVTKAGSFDDAIRLIESSKRNS